MPSLQWSVRDPDGPSGAPVCSSLSGVHFFNPDWYHLQNTRCIVVSSARRKEEDWDEAENGGFAAIGPHIYAFYVALSHLGALHPVSSTGTDSKTESVDPLSALEKTAEAQAHTTKVQAPCLEQLEDLSAHYNDDPHTHSQRASGSCGAPSSLVLYREYLFLAFYSSLLMPFLTLALAQSTLFPLPWQATCCTHVLSQRPDAILRPPC